MSADEQKTCKGSIVLGTACGACSRCIEDIKRYQPEAVMSEEKKIDINVLKDLVISLILLNKVQAVEIRNLDRSVTALKNICGDKDLEIAELRRKITL